MNKTSFFNSIDDYDCPATDSIYLQSLWYDHKGDWSKAHDLIQHLDDVIAARIHAYLHRKEGDNWNADYWYGRAGVSRSESSLNDEWVAIVDSLIYD